MPAIITLSDEDSKRYIQFIKHYGVFNILLDNGFFDMALGSCIIDFDSTGKISSIKEQRIKFNRNR